MRFISSVFAGAALVAAALAVEINSFPSSVKAGSQAVVKYSPGGNTPTTIILRKGESTSLTNVTTLTESATGGSFTWNVPSQIPSGTDYALFIIQGSENNFWGPFAITGGTAASSSASSSAASSSAPASSSASASVTSSASAASSTPSASAGGNSTVTSATLSTTARPTASGSPTSSGGVPNSTGAASTLGSSPLALIFGAVAAMAYLN